MSALVLHPKFCVNPTVPICFWCTKPKGELALLGNKFKGEAPKNLVLDYEPCKTCEDTMSKGIVCAEIDQASKLKRPSIMREGAMSAVAFTGRWLLINRDDAINLGFTDDVTAKIVASGKGLMEPNVFEKIFGDFMKEQANVANEGSGSVGQADGRPATRPEAAGEGAIVRDEGGRKPRAGKRASDRLSDTSKPS